MKNTKNEWTPLILSSTEYGLKVGACPNDDIFVQIFFLSFPV